MEKPWHLLALPKAMAVATVAIVTAMVRRPFRASGATVTTTGTEWTEDLSVPTAKAKVEERGFLAFSWHMLVWGVNFESWSLGGYLKAIIWRKDSFNFIFLILWCDILVIVLAMKWLKSKNKIISEMRSVQFQYIITVSTDTTPTHSSPRLLMEPDFSCTVRKIDWFGRIDGFGLKKKWRWTRWR